MRTELWWEQLGSGHEPCTCPPWDSYLEDFHPPRLLVLLPDFCVGRFYLSVMSWKQHLALLKLVSAFNFKIPGIYNKLHAVLVEWSIDELTTVIKDFNLMGSWLSRISARWPVISSARTTPNAKTSAFGVTWSSFTDLLFFGKESKKY